MIDRLVVEENRPCAICGVTNAAIERGRRGRSGASQIGTHHAVIEWALMDAVDLRRFNALAVRPRRGSSRAYARSGIAASAGADGDASVVGATTKQVDPGNASACPGARARACSADRRGAPRFSAGRLRARARYLVAGVAFAAGADAAFDFEAPLRP
jgi:hypothetical protein